MTTLNNDELRKQIDASMDGQFKSAVLAAANGDTASMGFYVDIAKKNMLQLIATHDQQLLEAILEGAIYTGDPNGVHRDARGQVSAINLVQAVLVEHIKSVFKKEGE